MFSYTIYAHDFRHILHFVVVTINLVFLVASLGKFYTLFLA